MRIVAAAAVLFLSAAPVFAAEAEGEIKTIDRDQLTITLDNGKSYKLPGEFDLDALQEGMDVVLAYDEVGGVAQITDMDLSQ